MGGVEAVLEKEESPCWKRFVKQVGVKESEGVMDDDSGESTARKSDMRRNR